MISPVPTHPTDAGNRARVLSLSTILREIGHDVYFMHVEQEWGDAQAMRENWGDRYMPVDYMWRQSIARIVARRIAWSVWRDRAYIHGLDEWYDPAIDTAIDALDRRVGFDAVIVEYVFMSRALLRFRNDVLKVIDTHDVFANRHRHYLRNNQPPVWFSCSPRDETKGLNRAHAVLAIQADEAADFRARIARPVVTVGHAVELRAMPATGVVAGRILAVGSGNTINIASLQWFVAEVLPQIRAQQPAAELALAGMVSRRFPEAPGVRFLGTMKDLALAYASAEVVVNPIQFGTGLKIKTLEALGYARALVTTPCGAAGLEEGAGTAFKVASDARSFADEVLKLLVDRQRSQTLGAAGYRFATDYSDSVRVSLAGVFGAGDRSRAVDRARA
jgi:glycosyltransferase involved in cell wall biosynthesis